MILPKLAVDEASFTQGSSLFRFFYHVLHQCSHIPSAVLFTSSTTVFPPSSWRTECLPVLLRDAVGGADLVAKSVVLVGETLALLLQSLELAVLLPQCLLELRNLAELAGLAKTRLALLALGVTTSKALVLLLETEDFEDHGVGAVEDERQEECEAAKVHVALRVELAGLDLHTLAAGDGAVIRLAN